MGKVKSTFGNIFINGITEGMIIPSKLRTVFLRMGGKSRKRMHNFT